jgi:hypothetical protein
VEKIWQALERLTSLQGTISLHSLFVGKQIAIKPGRKKKKLAKNAREGVKAGEGGITVKSFRKV